MAQFRRDPIIGQWVIVHIDDSWGPEQYKEEKHPLKQVATCQFCPGREHLTPPELDSVRPSGLGWKVRVVSNKFPALKIEGKPAYIYARQGKEIEMVPRQVEIKEIELLSFKWPFLFIRAVTGPGVYIRSLARDIGEMLGVGGYLMDLERTRVGEFTVGDCVPIHEINNKIVL